MEIRGMQRSFHSCWCGTPGSAFQTSASWEEESVSRRHVNCWFTSRCDQKEYPLESRQLVRCNEKNAQITETNTNSKALSHSVSCLYASCHVVLRQKGNAIYHNPFYLSGLRKGGINFTRGLWEFSNTLADIWIPISLWHSQTSTQLSEGCR